MQNRSRLSAALGIWNFSSRPDLTHIRVFPRPSQSRCALLNQPRKTNSAEVRAARAEDQDGEGSDIYDHVWPLARHLTILILSFLIYIIGLSPFSQDSWGSFIGFYF